jgi:hypothetical protein
VSCSIQNRNSVCDQNRTAFKSVSRLAYATSSPAPSSARAGGTLSPKPPGICRFIAAPAEGLHRPAHSRCLLLAPSRRPASRPCQAHQPLSRSMPTTHGTANNGPFPPVIPVLIARTCPVLIAPRQAIFYEGWQEHGGRFVFVCHIYVVWLKSPAR